LHEEFLSKKTLEQKADIGFAFDGDADRVIAADCEGHIINGDSIIYILAKYLKSCGRLKGDMVVGTHHTNMGMEMSLKECGITLLRADIGDHFVACEMEKYDCILGGEQSGHIILKDYAPTGDGILAALQLVNVLKKTKKTIKELNDFFVYPQTNINIQVKDKHRVLADKFLQLELARIGKEIASFGRLLVRASGTEPKVRIMTECMDERITEEKANEIAQIVKKVSSSFN
jgi:phosphoglucosamine mutase